MELIDAIKGRKSVRKFSDREVTDDDIRKIADCVRWVPSWKNTQTAGFIAVRGGEKQKIAEEAVLGFEYNTKTISRAPVLIVQTMKKGISGYEKDGSESTPQGSHWQSYDAGIAGYAFELAAFELGLGTVIMGIIDEPKVKEILGLPDDTGVSALIALGYPEGPFKGPDRKGADEILEIR
ncbi:MAG: nitroreductase family protein [Anaerovoracaceae bacterium]|nr:nitroreductase family protein [Anaerovoracaceae bacterium]